MVRTKILLPLLATAGLAACAQAVPEIASKHNPTLYSVHQPVVQRTDYVLDLASTGNGLQGGEDARLSGWLEGLQLGYGDRVWIDAGSYEGEATRAEVANVVGAYGLLLNEGAPITAGVVEPGRVRVVISRTAASVPGCPDWAYAKLTGAAITTDSNYGCAINSNLAAMIADPNDLVRGQAGAADTDAATGSKAVNAYRSRVPSGSGGAVKPDGGK